MKRSFGFRRLALPAVLAAGIICVASSAPACPYPPPVVTITASDADASEVGPDTGTFTVTRTGGNTSLPLTVYYRTAGTATPGSDYQSLDGWVQIPENATSATITLTPIPDADCDEGAETATVLLIYNANYEVGTPYYATVTIVDFNSWDLVANCANALTGIDTPVEITLTGSIPAACGALGF